MSYEWQDGQIVYTGWHKIGETSKLHFTDGRVERGGPLYIMKIEPASPGEIECCPDCAAARQGRVKDLTLAGWQDFHRWGHRMDPNNLVIGKTPVSEWEWKENP